MFPTSDRRSFVLVLFLSLMGAWGLLRCWAADRNTTGLVHMQCRRARALTRLIYTDVLNLLWDERRAGAR